MNYKILSFLVLYSSHPIKSICLRAGWTELIAGDVRYCWREQSYERENFNEARDACEGLGDQYHLPELTTVEMANSVYEAFYEQYHMGPYFFVNAVCDSECARSCFKWELSKQTVADKLWHNGGGEEKYKQPQCADINCDSGDKIGMYVNFFYSDTEFVFGDCATNNHGHHILCQDFNFNGKK